MTTFIEEASSAPVQPTGALMSLALEIDFTYDEVGRALAFWGSDVADLTLAKPGSQFGPMACKVVEVLGAMVYSREPLVRLPAESLLADLLRHGRATAPARAQTSEKVNEERTEVGTEVEAGPGVDSESAR